MIARFFFHHVFRLLYAAGLLFVIAWGTLAAVLTSTVVLGAMAFGFVAFGFFYYFIFALVTSL